MIVSVTGLIRGYVVPSSQNKRTSPLLMEDFVDQLGNGNFEQFGQAGERDSSSFFSKTTFGDTEYKSYGSISVEQLQFISLDKKLFYLVIYYFLESFFTCKVMGFATKSSVKAN